MIDSLIPSGHYSNEFDAQFEDLHFSYEIPLFVYIAHCVIDSTNNFKQRFGDCDSDLFIKCFELEFRM